MCSTCKKDNFENAFNETQGVFLGACKKSMTCPKLVQISTIECIIVSLMVEAHQIIK